MFVYIPASTNVGVAFINKITCHSWALFEFDEANFMKCITICLLNFDQLPPSVLIYEDICACFFFVVSMFSPILG